MTSSSWKSRISILVFCVLFGGCAALPFVIPPLIEFAGGLIKTAMNNYNKSYNQDLQQLMMSLQQRQGSQFPQNNNSTDQGFSQDPYQDYSTSNGQGFPYPNEQDPSFQQGSNDQYAQESFDDMQANDQFAQPQYTDTAPSGEQYPQQPYEEASYSQDQQPFDGQAIEQPIESEDPISLDVLLVRKTMRNGALTLLPINDGDVLRDGRGNPQAGDKFLNMIRANKHSFVYVIAIDGSAWAQGVFPPPGNPFANPVKAGQQYVIPEGNNWFSLDQFQGIETVFFVASPQKRDDIETIMTRIAGRERNPSETPLQVTEAPIIPQGFSGARRSRSPFAIHTGFQQGHELLPTTFFANTAGEALRVTRWFRHH